MSIKADTAASGFLSLALAAGAVVLAAGCGNRTSQNFEYMPQMIYTPALMAQEEGAMRTPPEGTVARGKKPYAYAGNPELAGTRLHNPLPRTKAVLKQGQEYFNIYCAVCHGPYGEGNGSIVPKFPQPPTLQSDKVKGWPDGRIFHVTQEGQNLMPSYASQIPEEKRWAIIHYIRVLHRAKNPTAQDLERMKSW